MKLIILVALAVVAVAVAAPVDNAPPVEVVSQVNEPQPDGSFKWGYELSDGSTQQQIGERKDTVDKDNKPVAVIIIKGSYSYRNEKGELQTITYNADEDGYNAFGDSIPKPVEPVSSQ